MSYPEIAAAMGRNSHSSAVTAAQRLTRQIESGETVDLPGEAEPVPVVAVVAGLRGELGG